MSEAIKKRGGTTLFKELSKHGAMPLGTAVLTSAGKLLIKAIIHVPGINMLWRASERSIRDSVRNAMSLARDTELRSIAFPIICAGSGGSKREKAKKIMEDELAKMDYPLGVRLVVYAGKKAAKE